MNYANDNARTLLNSAKKWQQPGQKLIIAIDGYSGAGKTTLLEEVQKVGDKDVLIVNRDDFAIPREDFETRMNNASTENDKIDTLVNQTIDVTELQSFLERYKKTSEMTRWTLRDPVSGIRDKVVTFDFSKRILLLEGIFLFLHDDLSGLFDKKVFLDIDQEIADARRRKREQEKWGDDYFPDAHPDSWFRLVKIGFNQYLTEKKPKEQADLVITMK